MPRDFSVLTKEEFDAVIDAIEEKVFVTGCDERTRHLLIDAATKLGVDL